MGEVLKYCDIRCYSSGLSALKGTRELKDALVTYEVLSWLNSLQCGVPKGDLCFPANQLNGCEYHPLSICLWRPCLCLLSRHRDCRSVQRTELYSLEHPPPFLEGLPRLLFARFLPPVITGEYEVVPFSIFFCLVHLHIYTPPPPLSQNIFSGTLDDSVKTWEVGKTHLCGREGEICTAFLMATGIFGALKSLPRMSLVSKRH